MSNVTGVAGVAGGSVLITAGGTGGHVFPALAVAMDLRAHGVEVIWLGTRAGIEARVVPSAGIAMEWISVAGLRGKGVLSWIMAPVKLARALLQTAAIFMRRKPQVVLGMGGFVAGPGGVVARVFGKPLLIHEQNAVAGLTNRLLARIATQVLSAFPGSFAATQSCELVGNPIRAEIAALYETPPSKQAGPLKILILGGSLGAQAINQLIPDALTLLPGGSSYEIWHQTGRGRDEATLARYHALQLQARVEPFIDDMAGAYAWADFVICRAGALTISELAIVGLASLLIPYPHAVDDHQTKNAQYLADEGAAVMVQQDQLTAKQLAELLQSLLAERDRVVQMSRAARNLAKPDATQRVSAACVAALTATAKVVR